MKKANDVIIIPSEFNSQYYLDFVKNKLHNTILDLEENRTTVVKVNTICNACSNITRAVIADMLLNGSIASNSIKSTIKQIEP